MTQISQVNLKYLELHITKKFNILERKMYKQNNYQVKKPFSSFLSGISGKNGIPMWAYYINRGQVISSFGLENKNGSMMEFYPANKAYKNIFKYGFRTFLKLNDEFIECFLPKNSKNQTLEVHPSHVSIHEYVNDLDLDIKVTYFTLCGENLPGLVRKVNINFRKKVERNLEIIDGLTHILPAKLNSGMLKDMSNTLRSWMRTQENSDALFYQLSSTIGDSAIVKKVPDVNTFQTFGLENKKYIYDLKVLFNYETSMNKILDFSLNKLQNQSKSNQIPSAMVYAKISKNTEFFSLFSNSESISKYHEFSKKLDAKYFLLKNKENIELHDNLMRAVETKSSKSKFDTYLKYSYMDNVLRGGMPHIINTLEGERPYYIYSRKHGDLERDYNFFMLEPNYLSQGNGNFRDVLQNRRNDLFFEPKVKDFNIKQFLSFIQADGNNPLNIQGLTFRYKGKKYKDREDLDFLRYKFTPGQLYRRLLNLNSLDIFEEILSQSKSNNEASFNEGYWGDHFTYIYDLIETFKSVYPDKVEKMLYESKINYFQSPAKVLPRSEKYVVNEQGNIRQYGSTIEVERESKWLKNKDDLLCETSIFGKLLVLLTVKTLQLDPDQVGIMYEGGKPGWNDALNGLPGLFGSGVSEVFELQKISEFISQNILKNHKVKLLTPFLEMIKKLQNLNFSNFNERLTILEDYRSAVELNHNETEIEILDILPQINILKNKIDEVVNKYSSHKIIPTYFYFQADEYTKLNKKNHLGYESVEVTKFKKCKLPYFLEGNARYIKNICDSKRASELHNSIMESNIYDRKLGMFKTSAHLDETTFEIGRIKAFTPGWLESESIFLHMTYKYLLSLIVSGSYKEYYESLKTNLVCNLNDEVYGRSIFENSSFIASSRNPDTGVHGQGFVARLSGSTAEILSMWRYMFLGKQLFKYENKKLTFDLDPKLPSEWFIDGKVETRLFSDIKITYLNPMNLNTYEATNKSYKIIKNNTIIYEQIDGEISPEFAQLIRKKEVDEIVVEFS